MEREYVRAWSPALGRDMEYLRFGQGGIPLLAFPTSQGRFYQWEDFGLVAALHDRLDAGSVQLWCVDTIDSESWYAHGKQPWDRVQAHLAYERYLVEDLLPVVPSRPLCAGPSFGAFHAVLLCLRRPWLFGGWLGMSGVYDNGRWLDGYSDAETYLTNPLAFLPGLQDERYLGPLREMGMKVVVAGETDANARDSVKLGEMLKAHGVDARVDMWQGWAHDWPYWKDMLRTYL
ncbi:MAG: esterase [Candidatus Dormibacteraeota bacterium]|nr:esterase [Candidatus Dormibacteraeota bacterium]